MNERIQKFAEQAAHDTRAIHNNAYWRMQDEIAEDATWREKFAELIVRECASYMYENYPHSRYEINYMRKHMGDPNWNKPIGVEE